MSELPTEFLQRLQTLLSETHYAIAMQRFSGEEHTCFRINSLLAEPEVVLASLSEQGLRVEPLQSHPGMYRCDSEQRRALTESEANQNAWIYIMNPASSLPPRVLDPQPGEEVLDLTAAPGGKTLMLADLMHNQGRIAAVEQARSRYFRLREQVQRYGANLVDTYLKDGRQVWRHCENRFDRVLLDAPCSSEARFHVERPESYRYWSRKKIKEMQRKQVPLLSSALRSVKPGGCVVYSTCSFAPEENEWVVNKILKRFGSEVALEPIPTEILSTVPFEPGLTEWQDRGFDASLCHTARLLPDATQHAFYVAKLRKLA